MSSTHLQPQKLIKYPILQWVENFYPLHFHIWNDMPDAVRKDLAIAKLCSSKTKSILNKPFEYPQDLEETFFSQLDHSKENKRIIQEVKKFSDMTPLQLALVKKTTDMLSILIDEKDIDFELKNKYGQTPLHLSITLIKSDQIANTLIFSQKVDIQARFENEGCWNLPVHIASTFGKVTVLKVLEANGADINAKNSSGVTSLFIALVKNKCDLALEIIKMDSFDLENESPSYSSLRHLIYFHKFDILKCLLEKFPNAKIKPAFEGDRLEDQTPLEFAIYTYNKEAIDFLKKTRVPLGTGAVSSERSPSNENLPTESEIDEL